MTRTNIPDRIELRRGLDVPLAAAPKAELDEVAEVGLVAVQPLEAPGVKPRLLVKVGESVLRGSPVVYDKARPELKFCSPSSGTVRGVELGPRRALLRILIEPDGRDRALVLEPMSERLLQRAMAEQIIERLSSTGMWALLRERPFSKIPNPSVRPKAVFVNAMNTAPFQADAMVVAQAYPEEFRAGLWALRRLTDGPVFVCVPDRAGGVFPCPDDPTFHVVRFAGPHPAGNTSVHIHHLAPIRPGEVVWTARAVDLPLIGAVLIRGEYPAKRIVALGGPGVREGAARHYRIRLGSPIAGLTQGRVGAGELRIIAGDALSGTAISADAYLPMTCSSVTVLFEDRERHLLAWANPFTRGFSWSRTFLSAWRSPRPEAMGTNRHGAVRAMIVTGLYDRFLPMNIRLDFLIRAVLAQDWEEAIALGLLELDPEDVALAAYACPSKIDLVGIVRDGLARLAAEGV